MHHIHNFKIILFKVSHLFILLLFGEKNKVSLNFIQAISDFLGW